MTTSLRRGPRYGKRHLASYPTEAGPNPITSLAAHRLVGIPAAKYAAESFLGALTDFSAIARKCVATREWLARHLVRAQAATVVPEPNAARSLAELYAYHDGQQGAAMVAYLNDPSDMNWIALKRKTSAQYEAAEEARRSLAAH
jgi:hypothetical protein